MAQRAFVVGMIRTLRRLGPLPRRRRVPQQRQPDLIRLEYWKALLPFVHVATRAMAEAKGDIMQLLVAERQRQGKYDDFAAEAARAFVQRAREMAMSALEQIDLEAVIERFARRTSEWQRGQLDRQVVAALAVPLALIEEPVRERIATFVQENVDLIKSVHARYFDRVEKDVAEAYERGTHPRELAELFVERDGMAERDARRIARDQIGKLNAQVNEERQKGLGLTSYIWRSVRDQRVRDEHRQLDGREFKWSQPPPDGHPGEPIQCRCFAEPVFDPLL